MIVLGGVLGGLIMGFGIVLLTAPATATAKALPLASPAAAVALKSVPGEALVRNVEPFPQPQHATPRVPILEPSSLTVAAHGSLNCTKALKVLNDQGKLSSATLS